MFTMLSRLWLAFCVLALLVAACTKTPRSDDAAQPARRIASQTVLTDEILYDLGPRVRERVVAISVLADNPLYSEVASAWPQAVPRVGASSEVLLSLAPDLVFVATFTSAETRHLLERSGIEVHVLDGFSGFEDYRKHVRAVAKAVDARDEGERIVARFDAQLATLRRTPREHARIISWIDGRVAGAGTSFDAAAQAAGLTNLAAMHGIEGHRAVSLEQLLVWDPDLIVTGCGSKTCETAVRELASSPGIASTRAARSGAVAAIPDSILMSTGRGMLRLVEHLARLEPSPPS